MPPTDTQVTVANEWPLGAYLREFRKQKRLSQTAAAQRADMSQTMWQMLESGKRRDGRPMRPKAQTVMDAAGAVGADPRHALELAGHDPALFKSDRPGRQVASQAQLIELFSRLDQRQRAAVIELMESVLDRQEQMMDSAMDDLARRAAEVYGGDEATVVRSGSRSISIEFGKPEGTLEFRDASDRARE